MKIGELFRLCIELLGDFVKIPLSNLKSINVDRFRKEPCSNIVYVGLHEWGGYEMSRRKSVNIIRPFECGLKFQIERFRNEYHGKKIIDLTITMSDSYLHNHLQYVKDNCDQFIETENVGMDFAGYCAFFNSVKNKQNSYILLTNTSVNSKKCDFIDSYIDYMDKNLDVGMMGISYNSRMRASFVRNNFMPHLQSFFLLTTTEVLSQVVDFNKGEFPGANIELKQLLIRDGEIKISQSVLMLGYKIAVVTKKGVVKFTNSRKKWKLKFDDCRLGDDDPNCILPI